MRTNQKKTHRWGQTADGEQYAPRFGGRAAVLLCSAGVRVRDGQHVPNMLAGWLAGSAGNNPNTGGYPSRHFSLSNSSLSFSLDLVLSRWQVLGSSNCHARVKGSPVARVRAGVFNKPHSFNVLSHSKPPSFRFFCAFSPGKMTVFESTEDEKVLASWQATPGPGPDFPPLS